MFIFSKLKSFHAQNLSTVPSKIRQKHQIINQLS